jgi:hypothetical protein
MRSGLSSHLDLCEELWDFVVLCYLGRYGMWNILVNGWTCRCRSGRAKRAIKCAERLIYYDCTSRNV